MQFRMKNAPKWFCDVIYKHYIDELHAIEQDPNYNDQKFKEIAVEYFTCEGFTVWLDKENRLCFDVDPDSPKWTFEILRS